MGFFSTVIFTCLDKHFPLRKVSFKYSRRHTPWFSEDIKKAIQQKNKARMVAEHSGNPDDFLVYRKLKNSLKTLVRSNKLEHLQDVLRQSRKFSHMASKLWEQVNEIIGRKKLQKLVSVGGQLSLDQINNFFRTVAISSNHQPAGDFVPDCNQHAVKFKFCTFSVSSVLTQLQTLNIKKATGPDDILACFLRSVAEELAEPLTFIFNMSIRSGSIPRAWKQSNVSPIHKGGSCDDPGNFRPISVVPIIAKVLEKLIANQLLNYFETHHLLHDHQGAYRCGRSSDQTLLI